MFLFVLYPLSNFIYIYIVNLLRPRPNNTNYTICLDFALDAKMRFDDNAEFRQADLFSKRDYSQEDQKEVAAAKFDLNYIALDGSIGCMVNGAGKNIF